MWPIDEEGGGKISRTSGNAVAEPDLDKATKIFQIKHVGMLILALSISDPACKSRQFYCFHFLKWLGKRSLRGKLCRFVGRIPSFLRRKVHQWALEKNQTDFHTFTRIH